MISLALLSSTGFMAAALIPTTTDRLAVWGLVALVIGLIVPPRTSRLQNDHPGRRTWQPSETRMKDDS